MQHPARPQVAQANRVVADPVDQARDRGDRRGVVAREAGGPPVRGARRPRPVLELVIADVIERLDHDRAGEPPGHDLTAPAVFEGLQDAVAGRPVVHRVDHELAVEQRGIDVKEAVQWYREHHDVRLGHRVAGPPRLRAGNDQLGDQRDIFRVARRGDGQRVPGLNSQPCDDRPDMAGAEHREPA